MTVFTVRVRMRDISQIYPPMITAQNLHDDVSAQAVFDDCMMLLYNANGDQAEENEYHVNCYILLLKQLGLLASMTRQFVAIEKSSLKMVGNSMMKDVRYCVSSMRSLFGYRHLCGFVKMLLRKVLLTWWLETYVNGSTTSFCPHVIFP